MAIIGIDLGTTNSAMAIYKNNRSEIIENREGGRTTPSIFQIDHKGEIKVGPTAKREYSSYPNETALEVKRLMGTEEQVSINGESYRPEEISSHILTYMKKSAEEFLGEKVEEAVITVPAYFSDSQRKATQKAGEIAGLKVERIINEPTAAAIAYGMDRLEEDKHVAVYDLGGGTFDVSIVELFSGVLEVKASAGDNQLGGMDFDRTIVQWLIDETKKTDGINLLEIGSDMEIAQREARLKEAAEIAKISLSTQGSTTIHLPFIAIQNNSPVSINLELTRAKFEKMIKPQVETTLQKFEDALKDAHLTVTEIDDLIFVGGSTRIPLIEDMVKERFGRTPIRGINPDEAVAIGASIQAGIKSGSINSAQGLMVIDICPYTLGVEVVREVGGHLVQGYFDTIIPKNSPVPITESKVYYTTEDNQNSVYVPVYQTEHAVQYTRDAMLLSDNIILEGVPSNKAGREMIEVTFSYDINGTLQVEGEVKSTGSKVKDVIQTQVGVMSEEEVTASKERMEEEWKQSQLYDDVKHVINRAEKVKDQKDQNRKEEIENLISLLQQNVKDGNGTLVKKYERELTDLLIELV